MSGCHPRRPQVGKGIHSAEPVRGFPPPSPRSGMTPAVPTAVIPDGESRSGIGCRRVRANPPPVRGRVANGVSRERGGACPNAAPLLTCFRRPPSPAEREYSGNVLSLFLTILLTSAISVCRPASIEGRAREASQCGGRHGPVVRLRKLHRQEAQAVCRWSESVQGPRRADGHRLERSPGRPRLTA